MIDRCKLVNAVLHLSWNWKSSTSFGVETVEMSGLINILRSYNFKFSVTAVKRALYKAPHQMFATGCYEWNE